MDYKGNKKDKFVEFMKSHVTVKDSGVKPTHTTMAKTCGMWKGSYNIPDENQEEFLQVYKDVLNEQKHDPSIILSVIERPHENLAGPILIDLDFRQDGAERVYTRETVKYIISKYNELIRKYVKTSTQNINAFLLEKPKPSYDKKQNNYKDGFHVVYPQIIIGAALRYKILEEVQTIVGIEGKLSYINFTNSLDDVFDKAIVLRNGWMMYGSEKEDGTKYALSAVYDNDLDELDADYTSDELVDTLSIRNNTPSDLMELTKEYDNKKFANELEAIYEKYHGKAKKEKTKADKADKAERSDRADKSSEKEEDDIGGSERVERMLKNTKAPDILKNNIDIARKLAKLLSIKRATDYSSWIHVGWALYNTDQSLLDAFIEFSKKNPKKYQDGCCERVWESARDGGGFTLSSLYWWAKEDNPHGYIQVLRENVKDVIIKAESGTHDDVASVVYELYKHTYACSSVAKNVWYEFQGHRWVPVENAYTLAIKISRDVANEFAQLMGSYWTEYATKEADEQDKIKAKAKKIEKLINNLKNESYINQILSACKRKFHEYNTDFEKKLDEKTHLIGFTNGVYDLKSKCFRNGVPDDYISLSTGYEYRSDYSINDPIVKELMRIFSMIQTEPDMRDYLLTSIATYLDGANREQTFAIWTGEGANGKSTINNLLKATFGGYFASVEPTLITRRRGQAGAATPELADKRGKRILIMEEAARDEPIFVDRMKDYSGGTEIKARQLYGLQFSYVPQFKMVMLCNDLPPMGGTDYGSWRRIRALEFGSKFVDNPVEPHEFAKDKNLEKNIDKFNQAFMWMLLNVYYPKYSNNGKYDGLHEPAKLTAFTAAYKVNSDPYLEFLNETYDITKKETDKETIPSMYNCFKHWYNEAYSGAKPPERKIFRAELIKKKFVVKGMEISGLKLKN